MPLPRPHDPPARPRLAPVLAAAAVAVGLLLAAAGPAEGQYFGRNQVRWEDFDFRVLETDHFGIYHYERERDAAVLAGRMSERWYARLSRLLDHEFAGKQPLVLYASQPDFRQTTAAPGGVGPGVGGLTEPLKRRVVMPMAGPLAETDHVLGHELVHAFQYDLTGVSPDTPLMGAPSISGFPTYLVEGMAEYYSVGPVSPVTSMWMRDALDREREFPGIRDLRKSRKFFPYRYGHALWSWVGGRFGQEAVREIFLETAEAGASAAIAEVTGVPVDTLSRQWRNALREHYGPVLEETEPPSEFGVPLVTPEEAGTSTNVAPAISPDGERIVYLSEKSLFSMEMYLADAETGEVIRKLTETAVSPHYQSLQFIESAGAWGPDGERFAFAAVVEGDPVLSVLDPSTGERIRELRFGQLGAIFNPTWSPGGGRVAFVGNDGGTLDLFVADLETGDLRRLTDDAHAELHPDWSPDGERIAFATDRFTSDLDRLSHGDYRLAAVDPETGEVDALPSLSGARNTNPQWAPDGRHLYFVATRAGIPNLYRVDVETEEVGQLTDVTTGIAGISELSPALSVARESGRVVFGAYREGAYELYRTDDPEALPAAEVADPGAPATAAVLPPVERADGRLAELQSDMEIGLPSPVAFRTHDYRPGLSLDWIGRPSLGFGASSSGVFVGGGASAYFSDMLGFHNLNTQLRLAVRGGEVLNGIGGTVRYVNRESRLGWGGLVGQVPEVTSRFRSGVADPNDDGEPELVRQRVDFWKIDRRAMGLVEYPLSSVQRIELSGGYERIDYDLQADTRAFSLATGREVLDRTREAPACGDSLSAARDFCEPGSLNQAVASAAWVWDSSVHGPTGPVRGQRFRVEGTPSLGTLDYVTALGDFRKYVQPVGPLTVAGRLTHLGRYGGDAGDARLSQLYLGYPSLVRGYGSGSFDLADCPAGGALSECDALRTFGELFGSRLLVSSLETRLPLVGPFGVLGRGGGFPPLDLFGFLDAGVAWTSDREPSFAGGPRDPVASAGVGLRTNLLGLTAAEVHLVKPFDRDRGPFVSFSFTPAF